MKKLLHLVGRKNHGKTTLLVELVRELRGRGLRIGTIKHSSHSHELDAPGKDSSRHRQAGAAPAAIVTADQVMVFLPRAPGSTFYASLEPTFAGCDLVLVEGDIGGPGVKVEVWRAEVGGEPLAAGRRDITAVVSDDPIATTVPRWPRGDVRRLGDLVLAAARELEPASSRTGRVSERRVRTSAFRRGWSSRGRRLDPAP
ncbi:MAG: molybdopterin-guanine dinucleotide biosynthesis protein B [Candidatus Riflebacteria bacterium]|nr:molybdopterin-guanine dinucleotide biosynthesis protein B [Candidatus Riflebacteria bacterium]